MQRDLYSALIKKRHKQRILVSIHQLDGRVTHEPLFDEVFLGYKARRIVLMTFTAAQDPRLPALPRGDVILPTIEAFSRIHQPHFQYRLLPLVSNDVEAFAALQGVCASRGSPFTISDRYDARELTFRFHASAGGALGAASPVHKESISAFFSEHMSETERAVPLMARRLPIPGVEFQGTLWKEGKISSAAAMPPSTTTGEDALAAADAGGRLASSSSSSSSLSPQLTHHHFSAAAFLTTHETLLESGIIQRALMRDFFDSTLFNTLRNNSVMSNRMSGAREQLHLMAVQRPVGVTSRMSHVSSNGNGGGGGNGSGNGGRNSGGTANSYSSNNDGDATASYSSSLSLAPASALHISATNRRMLLDLARSKNIFVYEKVAEGQYQFAC